MKYVFFGMIGVLAAGAVYQFRSQNSINFNLRVLEDRLGLPFGFFPLITNEKIVVGFRQRN